MHLKALAVRRELAAEAGAGPTAKPGWREARLNVARSLIATGLLREATGDACAVLASYEEARVLAGDLKAQGRYRARSPGRPRNGTRLDFRRALQDGKGRPCARRAREGVGHSAEAGRRQPGRHRIPERPGGQPVQYRPSC